MTDRSERETPGTSAGKGDGRTDDADPALAVRGLTTVFGSDDDSVRAVDDVSFAVESGTVVGLLGPNGAGKTTTIKSILGLVEPSAGEIEIAGLDARENKRRVYRRVDAMLEGARNIYWRLTVRENLSFFARLNGRDPGEYRGEMADLLEKFDVAGKRDTSVRDLSRGQKQKVSLVSTLMGDADLLFLDEPTLGLDVESSLELRRELDRLVDQQDLTVVLSSHDMDVIEDLCDRVVIMNDGEIIADDTVRDLVDLFRTQAFELVVEGDVTPALRRSLERDYDASTWGETDGRTRFEVSLSEADALHDLTGRLIDDGLRLVAVNTVEPDLEEVFLSLTERSPPNGSTATTAGGSDDIADGSSGGGERAGPSGKGDRTSARAASSGGDGDA